MLNRSESPPETRRIIGLTGGIGMGKTTISNYLVKTHHLPVLDADIYAREAVQPDSAIYLEVLERYGSGILLANGSLDRGRLGDLIFTNPAERLWLEQRIHPYVRDRLTTALAQLSPGLTAVLVVPLLFEARMTDLVSEIWVVHCPRQQQIERLLQRSRLTQAEGHTLTLQQVEARIDSQMPIERKIASAQVLLDNGGSAESLYQQVDAALASDLSAQLAAPSSHP